MCFFKAPKVKMPEVKDKPTITETTAPEPEAPVFGGNTESDSTETSAATRKSGLGSLKVTRAASMTDITGANRGLTSRV